MLSRSSDIDRKVEARLLYGNQNFEEAGG